MKAGVDSLFYGSINLAIYKTLKGVACGIKINEDNILLIVDFFLYISFLM